MEAAAGVVSLFCTTITLAILLLVAWVQGRVAVSIRHVRDAAWHNRQRIDAQHLHHLKLLARLATRFAAYTKSLDDEDLARELGRAAQREHERQEKDRINGAYGPNHLPEDDEGVSPP